MSDVWTKLKDIKSQMADLKRTISALTEAKPEGDGDESDAPDNVGDTFGGQQSKKRKKDE